LREVRLIIKPSSFNKLGGLIMAIQVNEKNLVNGTFDIAASIKEDNESTESKTVTLRLLLVDCPLSEIMSKAASSARISWQNGPGRKNFSSWTSGQVVEVDFSSPGKTILSPEAQVKKLAESLKAKGMTAEEMISYLTKLAS
jgi:hypothetical protein